MTRIPDVYKGEIVMSDDFDAPLDVVSACLKCGQWNIADHVCQSVAALGIEYPPQPKAIQGYDYPVGVSLTDQIAELRRDYKLIAKACDHTGNVVTKQQIEILLLKRRVKALEQHNAALQSISRDNSTGG